MQKFVSMHMSLVTTILRDGRLSFSDRDGQMYPAFVSSGHRSELLGEWSIIVGLGLR